MAKKGSKGGDMAVPVPEDDRESVRIRKISNGYIINRSGVKGGKYFDEEKFTPGKPVITAAEPERAERKAPSRRKPAAGGRIRPGSL